MSYCPVYGCNSDCKKNSEKDVHFFAFPSEKYCEQRNRRKFWIEFCKRKAFKPSSCTRICSLHFAEDAYDPAHSPQFFKSIKSKETTLVRLRKDALPTLNKPMEGTGTSTKGKERRLTEKRNRTKVTKLSIQ